MRGLHHRSGCRDIRDVPDWTCAGAASHRWLVPAGPMLGAMHFSWDDSRAAFADAAQWFVATTALVGDRWDGPGLGEWDVRALVGHTSRSLVTVETYLARPATEVDVASPTGYYEATRDLSSGPAVAE